MIDGQYYSHVQSGEAGLVLLTAALFVRTLTHLSCVVVSSCLTAAACVLELDDLLAAEVCFWADDQVGLFWSFQAKPDLEVGIKFSLGVNFAMFTRNVLVLV